MSEYNINLMKDGKKTVLPCSQYTVTEVEENSPAAELELQEVGIHIALGDKPENSRRIHLPTDGDTVYITNQSGKTIDSYRWPPNHNRAAVNRKEIRQ